MALSAGKHRHALAIPLPGQGHINPLMRFCKRLASQADFIITFVDFQLQDPALLTSDHQFNKQEQGSTHAIPAANHGKQKNDSTDGENIHAFLGKQENTSNMDASCEATDTSTVAHEKLDIRRVSIPMEIPKPGIGISLFGSFFKNLESLAPLIEELVCRLIHGEPPITCLISDLYMTGFTQKIADKFSIPRIAFHTGNQSVLLLKYYILEGTISLDQVLKVVTSKDVPKEDIFVEGLLGLPSLRNGDLVNYHEDNVFFYTLNLQILKEIKERAHAIVVNTSKELEEPGLKVNIGGIPIYAVGPLIEPLEKDTSTSFWKEDMDCMLWLSNQPYHSVLYISFGSFATLSKAQFEEIAAGLISSQQRFLWVLRPELVNDASDSTGHAELLSQSHGRGYLVEWAPQIRVLSHQSVGGFLTHCGWNSTVEAITLGVPMLCFPCHFDQFINAKFITEEWKVGVGFQRCKESGLVKRNEVERVIWELMVGEEGKVLQKNAKYFKEITQQNFEFESTLSKNIQDLVDSLPCGMVKSTHRSLYVITGVKGPS